MRRSGNFRFRAALAEALMNASIQFSTEHRLSALPYVPAPMAGISAEKASGSNHRRRRSSSDLFEDVEKGSAVPTIFPILYQQPPRVPVGAALCVSCGILRSRARRGPSAPAASLERSCVFLDRVETREIVSGITTLSVSSSPLLALRLLQLRHRG
jgi:hypothetical protein